MRKLGTIVVGLALQANAVASLCMPEWAANAPNKFVIRIVGAQWEPGSPEAVEDYTSGVIRVRYKLLAVARGSGPTSETMEYPLYSHPDGRPQIVVARDYLVTTYADTSKMIRGCGFIEPVAVGAAAEVAGRIRAADLSKK